MDHRLDPEAPMGWVGEGENRHQITYPCPSWFKDVEHAIRTDPAAAWYFGRQHFSSNLPGRAPQAPMPQSTPSQSQQRETIQHILVTPPPPLPSAHLSQQQQQQQQQHQQLNPGISVPAQAPPQQQLQQPRPPPLFEPPGPGQRVLKYDRVIGCQYCSWTGDRLRTVSEHLRKVHQVVNAQQGVDWVDWGTIKPRYG